MADRITFIIVVSLLSIGLLASYTLPTYLEFNKNLGQYYFVSKFSFFAVVSIFLMFIIASLNPEKWFNIIWRVLFYGGGLALLLMQFSIFSFMVPEINGARRWIDLGFFNIAPIEFFKIGFIGFLASNLAKIEDDEHRFKHTKYEFIAIVPFLLVLFAISYIVLIRQSDFGQTLMLWLLFFVMWFFVGANARAFFSLLIAGVIAFIFFLVSEDYRLERFIGWVYSMLPSFMLPDGVNINLDSYRQVKEALDAIHNGGFFGTFLGNGTIKLGFFSDVHTDFVLAGLGEEIGALGLIMITFLFVWLVKRVIRISKLSPKLLYKLFVLGMALLIGAQFIVNSLGEVGVIPIKGITVPFISYGGSSIIAMSIGIGIVLMLSKRSAI